MILPWLAKTSALRMFLILGDDDLHALDYDGNGISFVSLTFIARISYLFYDISLASIIASVEISNYILILML